MYDKNLYEMMLVVVNGVPWCPNRRQQAINRDATTRRAVGIGLRWYCSAGFTHSSSETAEAFARTPFRIDVASFFRVDVRYP